VRGSVFSGTMLGSSIEYNMIQANYSGIRIGL